MWKEKFICKESWSHSNSIDQIFTFVKGERYYMEPINNWSQYRYENNNNSIVLERNYIKHYFGNIHEEKVQSTLTIENFIDNKWQLLGSAEHVFLVENNGHSATNEQLLWCANQYIKTVDENYRVVKAEGQIYFGDPCGPQGIEGSPGLLGY